VCGPVCAVTRNTAACIGCITGLAGQSCAKCIWGLADAGVAAAKCIKVDLACYNLGKGDKRYNLLYCTSNRSGQTGCVYHDPDNLNLNRVVWIWGTCRDCIRNPSFKDSTVKNYIKCPPGEGR
jgi:hypothetical protein